MADEKEFPKATGDPFFVSEANTLNIISEIEAGENITAGEVVYINKNDGKAYVSDTGTADDIRADGIALETVTSGNDVNIQKGGTYGITCTEGEIYYLGASGAITTDLSAVEIGVAIKTNKLFINIKQDDGDTVGTMKPFHMTFGTADSGTDDAGTPFKLTETGQNFQTTIKPGMIVRNTTDETYSYVTAVDSDTVLSLAHDIMDNGENYTIYKTRQYSAFWRLCDGTAITDTESIYNGENTPDLFDATGVFLAGGTYSGLTGGASTHGNHGPSFDNGTGANKTEGFNNVSHLPPYFWVLFLIKIK